MAKKGSGILKKLTLSDDMAEFMGKSSASRAEIFKKIWAHIKKNDLNEGRTINPDETLEPILGSRSISMFEIAKKISAHVE